MQNFVAGLVLSLAISAHLIPRAAATLPRSTIAALTSGDEAIVVTTHTIQTSGGPLTYEARAGRLPIRAEETGEVHAYVFFTAYVVKNRGVSRPLTVAWNGGPTVPSIYVHTEFLGPRLVSKAGIIDNLQTLLTKTDLVFYDPVETGFGRVAKPEFAPEFFNMQGDVATAAEFIRAYRARFDAQSQPLYILGESYGVWRAGAVADFLAGRGVGIAGLMFISGGFPSVKMAVAFWNAMNIQTRTATALHHKRLSPAMMRDPAATMRAADTWARLTYLPALDRVGTLSAAERAEIVQELAGYTGVRPEQINPKTLVMNTEQFLNGFFIGDKDRKLADVDTRLFGDEAQSPERHLNVSRYLRRELGYATDLGYTGELGFGSDRGYRALEAGYMPTPGPARRSSGKQWTYNQSPDAAAAQAAGLVDGEVFHLFNANPPWTQHAMAIEPKLRVFVALGRFDPTNSCEGQAVAIATLKPELTRRITLKCYEAGHMIFRDPSQLIAISHDLGAFIDPVASTHR